MRVFVMVLIVLLTAAVSQELRGFAGTWAIDPAKVHESAAPAKTPPKDAPETPPPPPSKHEYTLEVIHQSGDLLKISGGEAGTTAVYTIDLSGKQVSDPIPDAPVYSASRIVAEKKEKLLRSGSWKEMAKHSCTARTFAPSPQMVIKRLRELSSRPAIEQKCGSC